MTLRRTESHSRLTPLFNSSLLPRHGGEKLPLSIFKAAYQLPGGNNRTCSIEKPHRVPPVGDLTSTMLPRQQRSDIYQLLRKASAYNQAAGVKTGRVGIAREDQEVLRIAGEGSGVYWPSFRLPSLHCLTTPSSDTPKHPKVPPGGQSHDDVFLTALKAPGVLVHVIPGSTVHMIEAPVRFLHPGTRSRYFKPRTAGPEPLPLIA